MESEHTFVELETHRVCEAGRVSGVGGNGLECHRIEFLCDAFIVEDISCRDIAVAMFSLIKHQCHDNG